ncbi:MAG TPA: PRC-barrel domain-containing protein [Hyphomicrobiaceae bacterium]|jgi:predicted O-methyltransferase YrrM|nr:PRC-barrel domain-containing protein [Hyphomicrobiaceae bacterium]
MEQARRVAFLGVLVMGVIIGVAGAVAEMGEAAAVPVKLESVLGRDVTTTPEGDAGRIIDLLVDRNGSVRAAVVEFGGFLGIGTRKIAIEWQAFRFSGRAIAVEVSREQVRAAPEYKSRDIPPVVKATSD